MKKLFLPFIAILVFSALLTAPALAQPYAAVPAPQPDKTAQPVDWEKAAPGGELSSGEIKAKSAILIDARTGKVLFEKDADAKEYPASITKIMTCLLALENTDDLSETVTVGTLPKLGDPAATRIDLVKGERMTMENLLYALMLHSANDAANAIAVHIAGSVDKFLDMMNEKAQQLGMTGTHYTNTNGLADDEDHYTTASDMAKLAQAAMKYPEFVQLVSTLHHTIPATNKYDKARKLDNTNYLLDDSKDQFHYAYATGIKTGYTGMAQNTLVSSAEKDGVSLIAVTLNDDIRDNIWLDSIEMFEYAFNFYDTVNLSNLLANKTLPMAVKDASASDPGKGSLDLTIKPQGDAYVTDRKEAIQALKNDPSQLQQALSITKETAPIKTGDMVGTVTYSYNGNPVLTCDLIASRDVAVMATPAPTASLKPAASPTKAGDATNEASAPANPSVTDKAVSGTSGRAGSAFIWIGIAALLMALAILLIRMWNLRRRARLNRRYSYRAGGSARMRR